MIRHRWDYQGEGNAGKACKKLLRDTPYRDEDEQPIADALRLFTGEQSTEQQQERDLQEDLRRVVYADGRVQGL